MAKIVLKDVCVTYPSSRTPHDKRLKSQVQARIGRLVRREGRERRSLVPALKEVSMSASEGDIVGIVGENGAGKTTLLRVIAGILRPDSGQLEIEGTVSTVFSLGAGFMPSLSGRENIHLAGALHGMSKGQMALIEEPIIEFSDLGEAIDRPLKAYSSGMKSRLGFSVVAFLNTNIVALDETLSAGDHRFRQKAGNLIERYAHERKILIVVSHSHDIIRRYCNRSYLLQKGEVVSEGAPQDVLDLYEGNGQTQE